MYTQFVQRTNKDNVHISKIKNSFLGEENGKHDLKKLFILILLPPNANATCANRNQFMLILYMKTQKKIKSL